MKHGQRALAAVATGRDVVWDQNVRMYGAGWNYNHGSAADRLTNDVGTSYFEYRR